MTGEALTVGIMTVNTFDFHPNGRLREEGRARGHRITLINPYTMGCALEGNRPCAFFSAPHDLPDLVMPRQGAPMGEYGFVLLRQFEAMKIPLLNGIRGVAIARNQFLTLQCLITAGLPVPDSCFAVSRENVFEAVRRLGGYPVVAKQTDGLGGDGVVRLASREETERLLARDFNPVKGLLVQSYIPPEGRRDLRLLVIGDRVAGAVALTPPSGGFKANIHQNGRAVAVTPDPDLTRLALRAAKACDLAVAGVDIMADRTGRLWVSEVNYSPGFRGLEGATGLNIAGMILDHGLNLVKGNTKK